MPGVPVAEHFNKPRHRLDDIEVCCVKQCRGIKNTRRSDEMCLIFHLDTLWPHGVNVDFIFYFLNGLTLVHIYPSVRVAHTTVNLFNDLSHSKLNIALKKGYARNVCYRHRFYFATMLLIFTTLEHSMGW